MKVLFVHSGADLYGASRCLLRLSSRLRVDGHDVLAILPCDGPLRDQLIRSGVEVVIHPDLPVLTRKKWGRLVGWVSLLVCLLKSIRAVLSLCLKFKPDVIHTNTSVILSSAIVARLARIPHVWHVRESFSEFSWYWRWYQWYMYAFADIIPCISQAVARQFAQGIQERRVVVIYDGLPRDEFRAVEESRVRAFRQRFALDQSPIIGVVGRIKFGRKGQDVFVKAVALLKDKYPDVKFLLVGSPFPGNEEHLERLFDLIRTLGVEQHVVYTGDVEDIQVAHAALDISVLCPSFPEPFGLVVAESMALAKPVVGTKMGGIAEQIENGVTGFLVEPNNPGQLAAALELLLSDSELRRKMGENGRKRFLEMFEFEPFYRKMLALYRNLIQKDTVR